MNARTAALTAAAMVAFAANSLLCRLALGQDQIDAASFTSIRVWSGAATLLLLVALRRSDAPKPKPDWRPAMALLAYMICFSVAYITLNAGTGALILFGAVQITMFVAALRAREHFSALSWIGVLMAIGGLVYLVSPGFSAPDPMGAALMAAAGIAWGGYTLFGRGAADPLAATANNFVYIAPFVLVMSLGWWGNFNISITGVALAIASGALASGCGYVIWYAALRGLTASRAAVVQLSVPVIAAIGAALFLAEPVTVRLLIAAAATLGGVAIVLAQRARA